MTATYFAIPNEAEAMNTRSGSERCRTLRAGVAASMNPRAPSPLLAFAVGLSTVLAVPRLANADGNAEVALRRFREAQALADAGKYNEACPKFAESLALERGVGVLFNLADCRQHLGQVASAYNLFTEAAELSKQAGQTKREQVARARAVQLEAQLAWLMLDVKASDPELDIRVGGEPVAKSGWTHRVAVEVGAVSVEVSAPHKLPWSTRLEFTRAGQSQSVTIPPLAEKSDAAPAVVTTSPGAAAPAEASPAPLAPPAPPPAVSGPPPAVSGPPPAPSREKPLPVAALAAAGVGVVGLGVGTAFYLRYHSRNEDAKSLCPERTGCRPGEAAHHAELVSSARSARTWTYVGFGVGAAALVGAAVLYIPTLSSRSSEQSSLHAAPILGADNYGAALWGTF
jgi:hypothetical protein